MSSTFETRLRISKLRDRLAAIERDPATNRFLLVTPGPSSDMYIAALRREAAAITAEINLLKARLEQ